MDELVDVAVLRAELASRLEPFAQTGNENVEQRCRHYLEALRWPGGVECPRCTEPTRLFWLKSRSKWHCYACGYQFSVTAGTTFHDSHLPIWKWFVSVELMLIAGDGITARQLHQIIGGSYKTAWFAAHRIRAAMSDTTDGERPLGSTTADRLERPNPTGGTDGLPRAQNRIKHPHISSKYIDAYANEHAWRIANHGNPGAFRDTILALLRRKTVTYQQLVATT